MLLPHEWAWLRLKLRRAARGRPAAEKAWAAAAIILAPDRKLGQVPTKLGCGERPVSEDW